MTVSKNGESHPSQNSEHHEQESSAPEASERPGFASSRLKPTTDSLDFSEQIATKLGQRFNRKETAIRAQKLSTLYFEDIISVVPEFAVGTQFEQGSRNSLDAFVEPYHNSDWIFVDDHLDIWLFALNFFTLIQACYNTNEETERKLVDLVDRYLSLSMTQDPRQSHLVLREETRSFHLEFVQILPVANALTVSMIIFILCHEISHHHLGHLNLEISPNLELEADKLAYELFLRVAEKRSHLKHAQIDVSTTSAPALMMIYFRAMNIKISGSDKGNKSHPPVGDRLAALMNFGDTSWTNKSSEKFVELKQQFSFLSGIT